jgi:SPP1 family predicted phage head-tail adaptor
LGAVRRLVTQATVWAEVTPVSGTEKVNGTAVQSTGTHRIRVRYRPDITSQWRIVYREQPLDLVSVLNVDGLDAELLIDARLNTQNP